MKTVTITTGKIDNAKVICINDSDKPAEIPNSNWIKKGTIYHITEVYIMVQQNRALGCKIAEINNDHLFPYQYFMLNRFAITVDDLEKLVCDEEIKEEIRKHLKPEEVHETVGV